MTCSQADKTCPVVKGAETRIAIPYDDPKEYDGSILHIQTLNLQNYLFQEISNLNIQSVTF